MNTSKLGSWGPQFQQKIQCDLHDNFKMTWRWCWDWVVWVMKKTMMPERKVIEKRRRKTMKMKMIWKREKYHWDPLFASSSMVDSSSTLLWICWMNLVLPFCLAPYSHFPLNYDIFASFHVFLCKTTLKVTVYNQMR